jgi:hypothetical protein
MWRTDELDFCGSPDCRERAFVSRDRFSVQQLLRGLNRNTHKLLEMRTVLLRQDMAASVWRISDDAIIERIAEMLLSGRLHIHDGRARTGSASDTPAQASSSNASVAQASAPFPLSESSPRVPPASPERQAIALDLPTFPPNTDLAAQAATLIAAAQSGTPACYI